MRKHTTIRFQSYADIISNAPAKPRRVFGEYFFEGEICILFGASNTGKSFLVNDICTSFVAGKDYWDGAMTEIANGERRTSILIDTELSDSQFGGRNKGFNIGGDFRRIDVDRFMKMGNTSTARIRSLVPTILEISNPVLLVIDCITNVINIKKEKEVTAFINELKKIRTAKPDFSVLLVGHTNKKPKNKPIEADNLTGSKYIINFCDSAIAIGEAVNEPCWKYVKHIKARSAEKKDSVGVIELSQEVYTHFELIGTDSEDNLIKRQTSEDDSDCDDEYIKHDHKQGVSIRKIADILGRSKSYVGRIVKMLDGDKAA